MTVDGIFGYVLVGLTLLAILVGLVQLVGAWAHRAMHSGRGPWRGRWVLENEPDHYCRTPNKPKRHTTGWRCACGQLYRARCISAMGDVVWTWDKLDEETGLTEREALWLEIEKMRTER